MPFRAIYHTYICQTNKSSYTPSDEWCETSAVVCVCSPWSSLLSLPLNDTTCWYRELFPNHSLAQVKVM